MGDSVRLQITLVRNGMTASAQRGEYLGYSIDESLLETERSRIRERYKANLYPPVEIVFTSPLLRCRETVSRIYPQVPVLVRRDLAPMDLGRYEGLNFHQIVSDKQFAQWASAPDLGPLGDGEAPYAFQARCTRGFQLIVDELANKGIAQAAVVAHRGVLESILQRFATPRSYYRNWALEYGGGYRLEYDTLLKCGFVREKI